MKKLREYGSTMAIALFGALLLYLLMVERPHPLQGQPAPDFTLTTVEGASVTLSTHRGKDVVVLDFWASWCPPCRKGLPVVNRVAKHFEGDPVAVYAVNIREAKTLVEGFVRANSLSLTVLLDEKGLVADDFGVSGIPQTVIIDKAGQIRDIHVGLSPFGFEDKLRRSIETALTTP